MVALLMGLYTSKTAEEAEEESLKRGLIDITQGNSPTHPPLGSEIKGTDGYLITPVSARHVLGSSFVWYATCLTIVRLSGHHGR